MDPGQIYKLKLSAPTTLKYARKATDGSGYEIDEHRYEYTITLTGALQLNGMPASHDQYTVAAFFNGTCRGLVQPEYMPALKAYRIYLTIYGDAPDVGEIIEFRVFNASRKEAFVAESKGLAFVTDKIVGQSIQPYVFNNKGDQTEKSYSLAQNKPNPFSATTTIDYSIAEDGPVNLTLYNELGKPVKVLVNERKATGKYLVIVNTADLAGGMYLYTLRAGNFVKTQKLLILH